MSKVLVDREEIEAVRNTLANGGGAVGVLRWAESILAQPAEAEGVEMGSDAWMALHLLDRLDVSADEEPRVQQVEEIVRRMGAALSAVTAERDRLRDAAGKAIAWLDAEQNGSGVGINRRLKLCRDAENSLRAAMAAKEA